MWEGACRCRKEKRREEKGREEKSSERCVEKRALGTTCGFRVDKSQRERVILPTNITRVHVPVCVSANTPQKHLPQQAARRKREKKRERESGEESPPSVNNSMSFSYHIHPTRRQKYIFFKMCCARK